MRQYRQRIACPACRKRGRSKLMRRDLTKERVSAPNDFDPILSDALGVNPKQIAEHKKAFPDIDFHPDGRMVVTRAKLVETVCKSLGEGWEAK
jgi:hypothetical protein